MRTHETAPGPSSSASIPPPDPCEGASWRQSIIAIAAVAAAYFITGRLGLALAIPPGYATAAWPPSGIALAAILLAGNRVWPGILLGSFLVDLSTLFDADTVEALWRSLAIPAIIAGGATLQALGGAFLVKRFGGFPNPLRTVPQIAGLLVLGGMAGCAINASISVGTLFAAGRMPLASVPFSWMTWWGGDTIGVCVFTPLTLALLMRPRAEWKRRTAIIVTATVATFALGVGLVAYTSHLERKDFDAQLADRGAILSASLESTVEARLHAIGALQAFLAHANDIDAEEFALFSARLRVHMPGVLALEWVARVPSEQRPSFDAWARNNGIADFQITENSPSGLVPAGPRPEYFPVTFVEPADASKRAVGFDLGSDDERRATLMRAESTGTVAVTGRIVLVQQGGNAVLAVAPVHRDSDSKSQQLPAGFALGIIRLKDLTETALLGHDLSEIHYWLVDETAPESPVVLSSNTTEAPSGFKLRERGLFGESGDLKFDRALEVGGRHWVLSVAPTQVYIAKHRLQNAWLVLVGGLLGSALVGAFAMVVTGREGELRGLVDDRTRTLQEALENLGRSEERFRSTFEQAAIGFIHTAFDGTLLEFNRRFCDIIGYPPEEVTGLTWQSITHPDDLTISRTEVARMLSGEISTASWEKRYIRKNGRVVWVRLTCSIQRDRTGQLLHFITAVEDIDRQKTAEARLAREAARSCLRPRATACMCWTWTATWSRLATRSG